MEATQPGAPGAAACAACAACGSGGSTDDAAGNRNHSRDAPRARDDPGRGLDMFLMGSIAILKMTRYEPLNWNDMDDMDDMDDIAG